MADATVAVDRLKALEISLNFAAKVAFDWDLICVNRNNDRVELFRAQIFRADVGINVGLLEDLLCVAWSQTIDVRQGSFDAFVAGDVYSK